MRTDELNIQSQTFCAQFNSIQLNPDCLPGIIIARRGSVLSSPFYLTAYLITSKINIKS